MRIFTNRALCQPGALLFLFYGMVGSRVPVVAIIGPLTVMRATGGVKRLAEAVKVLAGGKKCQLNTVDAGCMGDIDRLQA